VIKCEGFCQGTGRNLRPVSFEFIKEPLNLCAECEEGLGSCKTYRYTKTYTCECGVISTARGFCSCKVVER